MIVRKLTLRRSFTEDISLIGALTLLQRSDHFHLAVGSLELVKERTHFKLIRDALLELRYNSAVLARSAHFEHTPLTAGLAGLRRGPIHHLVALNVLRLLLHLRGKKKTIYIQS